MLKKISIKKISLASIALFALLLMYIIPKNDEKLKTNQELKYVDTQTTYSPIFLIDKNNYVSLTNVATSHTKIEEKAQELLKILIQGNDSSKLPNGFKAIIPADTKINSIKYEKGLIKVDFSDDLLEIEENLEEKMIEAIVYTLTSIDDVNKVIIYVDGEILTKLPKTKINLPSTLDRKFGINKEYEFTSTTNINSITTYYVNRINNNYYYVPVTKYLNDDREKITIVIDELTTNFNHNNNLMSFLNENTKLVSANVKDNILNLEFNSYIFEDDVKREVLEEVIYTICLSAYDNYDVKEVVLSSGNKEIYKSTSKTLETRKKM